MLSVLSKSYCLLKAEKYNIIKWECSVQEKAAVFKIPLLPCYELVNFHLATNENNAYFNRWSGWINDCFTLRGKFTNSSGNQYSFN